MRSTPVYNEVSFSKITFIVSDSDDKFIRSVFDDIVLLRSELCGLLQPAYISVNSKAEFKEALRKVKRECTDSINPYIHIACHGNDTSIRLTSGGKISYSELATLLTNINLACRNNLFLSMSSCFGGYLATELITRIPTLFEDKMYAPFYGIIGPPKTITNEQLEIFYEHYFDELLTSLDFNKTMNRVNNQMVIPMVLTTSLHILTEAFNTFLRNNLFKDRFKNQVRFNSHIGRMAVQYYRTKGIWPTSNDLSRLENVLKDKNFYLQFFNRIQNTFCMIDLYPEISHRFPPVDNITNWNEMINRIQ